MPRLAELLFQYLVREKGEKAEEIANRLAQDILTVKGRVLPPLIREQVTCMPDQAHDLSRPLSRRQDRHQERTDKIR